MKEVVLNEVKKELTDKQIEEVFEKICKYFNKETFLIERYINKY